MQHQPYFILFFEKNPLHAELILTFKQKKVFQLNAAGKFGHILQSPFKCIRGSTILYNILYIILVYTTSEIHKHTHTCIVHAAQFQQL